MSYCGRKCNSINIGFVVFWCLVSLSSASLIVGFYKESCPSAVSIIRKTVNKYVSLPNSGLGAGIIRLHFHDCFVRGCDGSVLLESTPGTQSEREHIANKQSLRGFKVINEAKTEIEKVCPNTVSCADILAFAARDSSYVLAGINYAVPAGRRDGRVSSMDEVDLPSPFSSVTELIQKFVNKGMSADEMVTLSGAHSTGISHCSSFSHRLYSFNSTHPQDPSMDPTYAANLKKKCPPPGGNNNPTVVFDPYTPNKLDNKYYTELKNNRGLLTSDQTLMDDPSTRNMVLENEKNNTEWASKFAKAMVHMGSLDVLTGDEGEIRTRCNFVN